MEGKQISVLNYSLCRSEKQAASRELDWNIN